MKNITRFSLLLLMLGGLSGCAAALVGGGAAGGYYAEKHKAGISRYADDAMITSKIKTKYLKDLVLKSFGISVSTNHGVVSLIGNVPNDQIRQRAINIAMQTKGVKAVDARNLTIPAMTLTKPPVKKKTTATHKSHHKTQPASSNQ